MNYGIFTWGTRGDVQPFIPLALGLMEQGEQVTLFAPENFKTFIEGYGIIFSPLHGKVDEILHSAEGLRVFKIRQHGYSSSPDAKRRKKDSTLGK